jgi:Golgi SNAP receptor complex protein 1
MAGTQLRDANNSLDALASDAAAPPPPAMARAIERHADVLRDYDREFARTRENVQTALDRESLLSGVRNDIEYVTLRVPSCVATDV